MIVAFLKLAASDLLLAAKKRASEGVMFEQEVGLRQQIQALLDWLGVECDAAVTYDELTLTQLRQWVAEARAELVRAEMPVGEIYHLGCAINAANIFLKQKLGNP